MRRTKVFIKLALCIVVWSTPATADELTPLAQIIENLKDETDDAISSHRVALRCMSNRLWIGVRLLQSRDITKDDANNDIILYSSKMSEKWRIVAKLAQMELRGLSAEKADQLNIENALIQVEAYTDSAKKQEALTGEYMPKTWVEDGNICKHMESAEAGLF